jgi:acyl-CoA oxidase
MITQQVASYLIKRMTAAVAAADKNPVDEMDANFKDFLRARRDKCQFRQHDIFDNDNEIVKAFQLRSTILVSNYSCR